MPRQISGGQFAKKLCWADCVSVWTRKCWRKTRQVMCSVCIITAMFNVHKKPAVYISMTLACITATHVDSNSLPKRELYPCTYCLNKPIHDTAQDIVIFLVLCLNWTDCYCYFARDWCCFLNWCFLFEANNNNHFILFVSGYKWCTAIVASAIQQKIRR